MRNKNKAEGCKKEKKKENALKEQKTDRNYVRFP
jgi:hypothetical protein